MAIPVGIFNIGPARIKYTETASEIPQGESDPGTGQYVCHISKPGQEYIMWCFTVTAALAAMDPDTLIFKIDPRFIIVFKLFPSVIFAVNCSRPNGCRCL